MIKTPARFTIRALLAALFFTGIVSVLPAGAGADATIGPVPVAGSPGLPDGRIYEQVSPADKNGNFVRAGGRSIGLAAEDGEAVVFTGTGAMGAASVGLTEVFVSRRSQSGWATSATRPRELGEVNITGGKPLTLIPSSSFSRFLFTAYGPYVSAELSGEEASPPHIFLAEDPAVEPLWVAQPTIANPTNTTSPGSAAREYLVVGGTPNFSTVYFTYSGTLLPQDASRHGWGFYEWSGGKLGEAGVLPDGTLDPFGAVPAATAGLVPFDRNDADPWDEPQTLGNELSADGSRAFFVSPDPTTAPPTPPELYVRETAPDGVKTTVLVSQSQLPGHEGEPAPNGSVPGGNTAMSEGSDGASYVYASPDGSQAFFASTDQLTSAAPANGAVKEYDYDLDTGLLTYLPGVTGSIAASSPNGSDFIFENTVAAPAELELWANTAGGGQVTPIAPLPPPSGVRSSANGAVFVFRSSSQLPGFNDGGGFEQVYRYSVGAGELTCVSCPPAGVVPSGDAEVSHNDSGDEPLTTLDSRVISSDGSRVFFDTPAQLVPQATNGMRDVYEWENGHVYLISSGESSEDSYVLDSSASGSDVFFTTSEGMASGDTDGSRDVYDARIPRPGDRLPLSAVPCNGDVCQGPPSVPPPLSVPSSATFSGAGNLLLAPVGSSKVEPRLLPRAQKLANALRACEKKPKRTRKACVKRARQRYGAGSNGPKSDRRSK